MTDILLIISAIMLSVAAGFAIVASRYTVQTSKRLNAIGRVLVQMMVDPDRPNQYDAEGTERTPEAEHALDVNEQTSQSDDENK